MPGAFDEAEKAYQGQSGSAFDKAEKMYTPQDSNVGPTRQRSTLKGPPKRSTSGDLSNLIEGTAKYASGAALPAAVIAPGAALSGAAGAYGASKLAEAGAKASGATDDQSRLAGNLGGIAGGAAAGALSAPIGRVVSAVGREMAPSWLSRLATAAADAWKEQPHVNPADPWAGPNKPTPKPNMAKFTPGAEDQYKGAAGKQVGMSGAPPPPAPSAQPSPKPFEPYRAKQLNMPKYSPGGDDAASGAGGSRTTPVRSFSGRGLVSYPSGTSKESTSVAPEPVSSVPNSSRSLAKVLKDAGIKPEDAAKMDADQWKLAASAAKFSKPPSAAETQQALSELTKMSPAEPQSAMNVRRRTKR